MKVTFHTQEGMFHFHYDDWVGLGPLPNVGETFQIVGNPDTFIVKRRSFLLDFEERKASPNIDSHDVPKMVAGVVEANLYVERV